MSKRKKPLKFGCEAGTDPDCPIMVAFVPGRIVTI